MCSPCNTTHFCSIIYLLKSIRPISRFSLYIENPKLYKLCYSTQEEFQSRLKSRNVCYHSVQNLLSFCLLSKNLNIKIYRTIILSVVLYGCETWSLTLREERRLRVLGNRALRRIFGPKRDEVTGEWRKL